MFKSRDHWHIFLRYVSTTVIIQEAGPNMVHFIRKIKSIHPDLIISQPTYGYPQVVSRPHHFSTHRWYPQVVSRPHRISALVWLSTSLIISWPTNDNPQVVSRPHLIPAHVWLSTNSIQTSSYPSPRMAIGR